MRTTRHLLTNIVLYLAAAHLVSAASASPAPAAWHIVRPHRPVAAGEHVELKLEPGAPRGVRVSFSVRNGAAGIGLDAPLYRAPYVIPPGTPNAIVSGSFSTAGQRVLVSTEIELVPGVAPGAEDCLGPGQVFSTVWGDLEPDPRHLDVLPVLVHEAEPEYPRSSFARGIEDTIHVKVLLCRTGHVLDADALPTYHHTPDGMQLIDMDPKLAAEAVAAARQYVFSPGMIGGQPVALWTLVPVVFRRE